MVQTTDTRMRNSGLRSYHSQPAYNGIKDVLVRVYSAGGARGLYRGVGVSLMSPLQFML